MKATSTIHLAFITDESFAFPTGVAIHSLAQCRSPQSVYEIHVVCRDVPAPVRSRLEGLSAEGFRVETLQAVGTDGLESYSIEGISATSTAVLKFRLPELFPRLDRILYLDGDILIRKDLAKLWSMRLGSRYVAAVSDRVAYFFCGKTLQERIGYPHKDYFNSGVMLLNLKKMRKDGVVGKLFDYRRNGRNDFMDQDAFNVILGGNVLFLPFRYNAISTCVRYGDAEHMNRYYPDTRLSDDSEMFSTAVIYHYASPAKPWKFANVGYRSAWLEAWRSSPYANDRVLDEEYAPGISSRRTALSELLGPSRENVRMSFFFSFRDDQKVVARTLEGLLGRNNDVPFEVICVDRGAMDNSSFVVRAWACRDPRVRLVSCEGTRDDARKAAASAAVSGFLLEWPLDKRVVWEMEIEGLKAKERDLWAQRSAFLEQRDAARAESGRLAAEIEGLKAKERDLWAQRSAFLEQRDSARAKVGALMAAAAKQRERESSIWAQRVKFLSERDAARQEILALKKKQAEIWEQRCRFYEQRDSLRKSLDAHIEKEAEIWAQRSRFLAARDEARAEVSRCQAEISALRASVSYKIGRCLTWPFRKVLEISCRKG